MPVKNIVGQMISELKMAKEQLWTEIKVIEKGTDKTKYEPSYRITTNR